MAIALFLFLASLPVGPGYESVPDKDDIAVREEVELLLRHPVDLNRAGVDDLLSIPWLSPLLAHRIISFRDSLGGVGYVTELRLVPGMTEEVYRSLLPVVTVGSRREPGWTAEVVLRAATDTMPPYARAWQSFGRMRLERGPWLATAILDRDRGERNWADWFGTGLQYSGSKWKAVLGDFSAGTGLGLVLAGPSRRAGAGWTGETPGPSGLRLAGSALENRNLRGVGAEFSRGNWKVIGTGSSAGRDARLNPDGTVRRLALSGVHDDSASTAGRNLVQEASAGLGLVRAWPNLRLGATASGVKYSRVFAPSDSVGSFAGSSLVAGGLSLEAKTGAYLVGAEAAFSSGGRGAGALEVSGRWRGLAAEMKAAGYDRRYFAPLGRWRTLTDRRSRLDCRGRVGYKTGRFSLSVQGNTYRDFELDSLPARIEACLSAKSVGFSAELRLGRSYKLEQERFRTTRFTVLFIPSKIGEARLVFADEYPELSVGRGMMFGIAAKTEPGRLWFALAAARFDISGPGIRMYMSEYGPMRTGSSFSTSGSAWRAGLGCGFRLSRGTGLGFKLGYTCTSASVLELGAQLEMELGS